MSLHNLAQHMQSAGRGEDKMLVHMTPGEVQGLQKLAMAHGGSLTINPETGLPEAGILSKLLPMAAGFALGPGGFALMSAPAASLAVGAVSALTTGSLSKGIMAGLGAYGGASLGGALGTMGATAAAPAASTLGSYAPGAAPSAFPSMVPDIAAPVTNAATSVAPGMTQAGGFAGLKPASLGTGASGNTLLNAGQSTMFGNVPPPSVVPPPPVAPLEAVAPPPVVKAPFQTADQLYAQKHPVLAGLKSATSSADGLGNLYSTMEDANKYSGMAAGYSLLSALDQPKKASSPKHKAMIRPYTFERKRVIDEDVGPSSSAEQRYFNDVYTAQTPYAAANGGIMGMADGGPVENMSQQNALGSNTGYPMARQTLPTYTGLSARPISEDLISPTSQDFTAPTGDASVDPYTGEEKFARGGIASLATGGGIPEYEYLGGNKYQLKTPAATTEDKSKSQGAGGSYGMSGSLGSIYSSQAQKSPDFSAWDKSRKTISADDVANIWKKMGGVGDVPADYMNRVSGLKRSEQEIASSMRKLPYFTEKFDPKTIDATAQAGHVNAISNAMVGRNATPEELARITKKNFNLGSVRDFYKNNVKNEYVTYQKKAATAPPVVTTPVTPPEVKGATPTQIANIYSNIFGGVPDASKLDYYTNAKMSPEDVKKSLMESDEYKKKLTTPFVAPITYAGSTFSPAAVKTQLGRDPTETELKTAQDAFVPNRATIAGAPQYQTPEQRIGLAPTNPLDKTPDFYAMMNKRLAEQAARLPVSGAPAVMPPAIDAPKETFAGGGDIDAYSLGGYSDGGRLLRGPGDGVSDSIPASIGDRQPARLADGEFVVPARIVSELGNGSTEAGAKRLYAMMDRVQKARQRTVGKGKVAVNSKADKYLPA